MDTCDGIWFPEPPQGDPPLSTGCGYCSVASPSAAACLSSPSSGYSSSDEGRTTPVDWDGALTGCLLSSDPYLGHLAAMTPDDVASRRLHVDAAAATAAAMIPCSWSGASLLLDDFMDTLWDSLTGGVDTSARPANAGII